MHCLAIMFGEHHLYLFLLVAVNAGYGLECRPKGKCSCEMSDGSGTIDLSPLSNTSPPRFKGIVDSFNPDFSFDYDPCKTFSNGLCQNVFVCQLYKKNQNQFNAGKIFGTKISDKNEVQFVYDDSQVPARKTIVTLKCDATSKEAHLAEFGESEAEKYTTTLTSQYACPVKNSSGNSSGSKKNGLSTGSILCILLLVTLILYVAIGIVINKFALKKEGKELVPNAGFWAGIPSLIKDGCVFLFDKVRGKPSEYERI